MNNGRDVLPELRDWAEADPGIRTLLLTSSRVAASAAVDALSDYDVIVVATDLARLLADESWIATFGEVLVRFNDSMQSFGIVHYTRLVLYRDGLKIDFSLWPTALLESIVAAPALPPYLDDGYRILVDKDRRAAQLQPPAYHAYIPPKPTEQEFLLVVNQFWWETTYVAKNLWREELFFAKYNLEYVLRFEALQTILGWYIETLHGWSLKLGISGRGFKRHLDATTWQEIESTFAGAGIEDNWRALFRLTELFRKLAMHVAGDLQFTYPSELDANVSAYLVSVQQLDKTANR